MENKQCEENSFIFLFLHYLATERELHAEVSEASFLDQNNSCSRKLAFVEYKTSITKHVEIARDLTF